MTAFPKGVRLIQPGDENRVFDLCYTAHADNGWGLMDEETVKDTLRKAFYPSGVAIAIIDGPERVEAVIGLQLIKPWYGTTEDVNWYWSDLLCYVHPLHRRSRHAAKLLQFARWWAQHRHPAVLGILPKDGDLERKEKLFGRYGKRIGSIFLFGTAPAFTRVPERQEIAAADG